MSTDFKTEDREQFKLFGAVLASVLRDYAPDKQWVISLEGDEDSGKSLLALAADERLHSAQCPTRYPTGITPITKVHKMLGIDAKKRESVYFSDGFTEFWTRNSITLNWRRFLAKNPQIKLSFLSNVWNWTHLNADAFDKTQMDKQIPVQVRINVKVIDGGEFIRALSVSCAEPQLEQLIKARFEDELRATQPAARKRDRDLAAHSRTPEIANAI